MISIIIPCKNRLNHLAETLPLVLRMMGEFQVIVVDYNCPMSCKDYLLATYPQESRLKVIKADVKEKEWNLSHSRNLGFLESKGEALLFLDADTKVNSDFLTIHPLDENTFYTGSWLHASGCCMVWRKDFEAIRGYNQVCEGWGTEDYNLYKRLETRGVNRKYFNEKKFKNMRHHDKTRNEFHGRAEIHHTNELNFQRTLKEFRSCIK